MPGQLGLMPILPPTRKNAPGIKGVSGGVNAAPPKGPRFPMPLDHPSSGLGHISGGVNAGGGAPLTGVSGHVSAPAALKAPHSPVSVGKGAQITLPIRGVRGSSAPNAMEGVSGGIGASRSQKFILPRINGKVVSPQQSQRALLKTLEAGSARVGPLGRLPQQAHPTGAKEILGRQKAEVAGIGPSGNLLKAAGPALEYIPKKLGAEAINIPAQAPVVAAQAGKATVNAIKGHPQELEQMGKEFANQSAVAHLFRGDLKGAAAAALEHPLGTELEFAGGASVADRLAGAIKGTKVLNSSAVVSREPQPLPEIAAPKGGVTRPLKPYDRGALRRSLEESSEQRPLSENKVSKTLGRNFDSFEAEQLAATRASRDKIGQAHHKLFKKLGDEAEAVPHFGSGLLGDPAVAREHLGEAITHFEKEPPNETIAGAGQRQEVLAHLRSLQGSGGDLTKAYQADLKLAAEARAKEPELVKHQISTPETMRIAKLIKPFQFHFRDEDAHVEPDASKGESPFYLGDKQIPVDEVAKKLGAKGVHEKQLIFSSTRPFMTEAQALLSGRRLGGQRAPSGNLTGHNFIRGHFDPSPEAITRQIQTTTKAINEARGQNEFNRRYPLKNSELARILQKRLDRAETEGQRTTLEGYIHQLRTNKDAYFDTLGGAKGAQQHLDSVGVPLEPVRVAHPYASAEFRQAMAKRLADHADLHDRLEPPQNPDDVVGHSRLPAGEMPPETAGPWALVHPTVAAKIREYERNLGSAHILQMPSSAWRRLNVAFSVRHIMPGGVPQEMGIRMAANNAGLISGIRGTRLMGYLKEYAAQHPDPEVKAQLQRLEAHTGGTIASFTSSQGKHTPLRQLLNTPIERPMKWWLKHEEQHVTGAPLKAMKMAIRGMNKTTNTILSAERKFVEHPPQTAGLGRHAADEFKRIHSQRMKVVGEMSDLEKQFARGLLDPKAVDHAANVFTNFWGDWMNSSPKFRVAQGFVPFIRWYVNSLRFIYQVMPRDHPVATGVIAALESATKEQRKEEGQGYQPGIAGFPTLTRGQLPEYQQGSIPLGGGKRLGAEYYTPSGAVSGGLEGILGSLLPYAAAIYSTMKGVNPLTNQPLEEEVEGTKKPIEDKSKLFWKGVLAMFEAGIPPLRYAEQLKEKPAGYVFRPFRTEKQHALGGKAAEEEGLLKKRSGGLKPELLKAEKVGSEKLKGEKVGAEKVGP